MVADHPVDIVDRRPPAVVRHGTTWRAREDALLDEISRLYTEHENAMAEIAAFLRDHPEHEDDEHLAVARLALL